MTEERRTGLGEGIRTGIGILAAFKEAIEETIQEAIESGDLSPERAGSTLRQAADRIQSTLEDARDRFELVPRAELERLRNELSALRARVEVLESTMSASSRAAASSPPDAGPTVDAEIGDIPVD